MNFLSKIFKRKKNKVKNTIEIIAPISGNVIDLNEVPDDVFAKKIVGDGVAINPTGNLIVSPVNGIIGKIFDSMHAFSIESDEGIELFVHFGIDTIELKGEGFSKLAKEKQKVKIGDPIIKLYLNLIRRKAKSILTPVIISNMDKIKKIKKFSGLVNAGQTVIIKVIK
ncbi:PTS system glucose-specific EIIA component [Buchnera aphidicola (Neophyllaphis podocarpi)]|uniref:PTS glucose transporter subunit IIA n=1 Tax=Buchnera aphidicola TaxID=9 RepID=UPI003464CC61